MSPSAATALGFSAPREALASMLDLAYRVANGKPIPILDSIYLELRDGDEARWWTTDTFLWLGGVLKGVVASGTGAVLLPVSALRPLLKSCADGSVHLALDAQEWLEVSCGHYRGKIASLPTADFPIVPTAHLGDVSATYPAAVFLKALRAVACSMCAESQKYFLRGALFTGDTWVSTDGHQMSRAIIAGGDALPEKLVPAATVTALMALLERHEGSETVHVVTAQERIVFAVGDDRIVSREIDARFPRTDYQFTMDRTALRADVDRESWLAALARAAATARRVDGGTSCRLAFAEDGLTILTQSPNGQSSERIAADVTGAMDIFINARYLENFLKTATTESVVLTARSDRDALSLQPLGDEGSFQYVVAPMRD